MAGKTEKAKQTEIRKLSDEQIVAEIGDLRSKLYTLRTQTATEKVEDLSQFKKMRRTIARLLTEQSTRRHAKSPVREAKAAPVKVVAPRARAKSGAGAAAATKTKKPTRAKAPAKKA
ncbi:MAG: 50S ribosomal protein L29 [Phycisphaerales bacterium]